MLTQWERLPLVPVTLTGGLPNGQSPNVIFSVDVANPPEDTVTVVGLKEVVIPPLSVSESETVPENPPVLVTLIVTECRDPAMMWFPRSEGFAVMVKSPVAWTGRTDGMARTSPSMIIPGINLAIPIFMFDLHIAASSRRALSLCIDMLGIFERGGRNYSGKAKCNYCLLAMSNSCIRVTHWDVGFDSIRDHQSPC